MGDYTRVGLVRSATGWKEKLVSSGLVNTNIKWGEAAMRKYLGVTPASDSTSMAGDNMWVELAATMFSAHYLAIRLVNENIANATYQRQTDGGARFRGHAISAEILWEEATRQCDLHGRHIIIKRVDE